MSATLTAAPPRKPVGLLRRMRRYPLPSFGALMLIALVATRNTGSALMPMGATCSAAPCMVGGCRSPSA